MLLPSVKIHTYLVAVLGYVFSSCPIFLLISRCEPEAFLRKLQCHLNISSEDTILALQGLGYKIISVKQMAAKRPTPEEGGTLVSLPFFLVTLVRNQKSQEIFKISNLCNITVKCEVYKLKVV
jgi:hypothetical protein